MNKKNITYVAGGGGMPAAIIHTGILHILNKNNYNITNQIGTSAGSIIGGFYAVSKELELSLIQKRLDSLIYKDYSSFKDLNISGLLNFYSKKIFGKTELHKLGKYSGNKFYRQLIQITRDMKFNELTKVNLYITATDLLTGQLIIFSNKTTPNVKIADAIRASCSIQGIFTPMLISFEQIKEAIFLRNSIKKPQNLYANKYNFNINDIIYKIKNNKYLILIDGGNLGNCRIDIGTNVNQENNPVISTSFTWMNKPDNLNFMISLLPHTIKIMMAATEKLIIKYAELKYKNITILRPNTLNINTTDFDINKETKNKLIQEGKKECKNKLHII